MEEAKKEYRKGFQVDGTALAGIFSTTNQHVERVSDGNVVSNFRVSLKDGSSQTLPDVSSVTSLQNVGKKEIISIELTSLSGDADEEHYINLKMSEPEKPRGPTISYTIRGPDREWVKSTQIDIDDFVAGVSRPSMAQAVSLARNVIPILIMVAFTVSFFFIFRTAENVVSGDLDKLSESLKNSPDAASAIYKYAEWENFSQEEANRKSGVSAMKWLFPIMLLMPISLALSHDNMNRIFKSYIFYTGGMVSIVNQRRTMHSIVWLSIVLAVAVGTLVNYITASLT